MQPPNKINMHSLSSYTGILAFNLSTFVNMFAYTWPLCVVMCGWYMLPSEIWDCLIHATTAFWIPVSEALLHTKAVTSTDVSLVHRASSQRQGTLSPNCICWKVFLSQARLETCRLWLCPHTDASRNINLLMQNRLDKTDKKPWKILECMIYFEITVGVKHISTFPHLLLDYKLGVHLLWCLSVFCKIFTPSSISYEWLEGTNVAFVALSEHSSPSPGKSSRLMPLSCDLWPAS